MKTIDFKVSVRCMTFNHASYIEDAMDGFCMQQTEFPYVCNIVDDASTDGEQEIIKRYLETNFKMDDESIVRNEETVDYNLIFAQHKDNKNCFFAIYLLKYNHYGSRELKKRKFVYLAKWESNVKYLAFCEGDDYWVNPLKLQKQYNFLEGHNDYGMTYGKCQYLFEEKKVFGKYFGGPNENFVDLLSSNTIPTLTVMCKKEYIDCYYNEFFEDGRSWKMNDYPQWLFISKISKIKYIPDMLSIYRVLNHSSSHKPDIVSQEKFLESMYDIKRYFCNKYCHNGYDIENNLIIEYARISLLYCDRNRFRSYITKIRNCPCRFKIIWYISIFKPAFRIISWLYKYKSYLAF